MVVGRLIVVLLLCLTFAGDSVPTVTSPSQPATSVVQVAPEDFASTVLASDHIWLMEFHSSAAPQFGRLAKEMEKAAFALKGICKLGSMDLGTEQAQKHLKAVLTLVPVLPSFRLFARNAPGMEQAFAQSPFAMGQKKVRGDCGLAAPTPFPFLGKSVSVCVCLCRGLRSECSCL